MKKLDRIMAVVMSLTGVYFLGFVIWQVWDQSAHPEKYVVQSAPWYTSIALQGLITAGLMAVEMIVYMVFRAVMRAKEQAQKQAREQQEKQREEP